MWPKDGKLPNSFLTHIITNLLTNLLKTEFSQNWPKAALNVWWTWQISLLFTSKETQPKIVIQTFLNSLGNRGPLGCCYKLLPQYDCSWEWPVPHESDWNGRGRNSKNSVQTIDIPNNYTFSSIPRNFYPMIIMQVYYLLLVI